MPDSYHVRPYRRNPFYPCLVSKGKEAIRVQFSGKLTRRYLSLGECIFSAVRFCMSGFWTGLYVSCSNAVQYLLPTSFSVHRLELENARKQRIKTNLLCFEKAFFCTFSIDAKNRHRKKKRASLRIAKSIIPEEDCKSK